MRNCLIKNRYQQHIYLAGMLIIMSLITGIGNRVNLSVSICFGLTQVCCILIPGVALVDGISIKGITSIENVLLSYSAGYTLSIILYFLTQFLNIYTYLNWIYILIFAVSFAIIVIRSNTNGNVQCSDWHWIWLLIILFVISFIVFSCRYALPTFIGSNQYFNDLLYWAGDAVELNMEFPPVNFRTLKPDYRYHYFSALQLAVISRVTGIVVARVALTYSFIQAVVLMGLSAYCLVARMIRNSKARVITLLLLFFSTGFEKEVFVVYFSNIYLIPMGFNTAYAFEMIIVLLVLIQIEKDKINIPNMIWMMAFLAICTGTKGPTGAIVMVGIGITCLQWLCEKKYKKAFAYGLAALFVFGMIYFLFLQGTAKAYNIQAQAASVTNEVNVTGAVNGANAGEVTESKKPSEILGFICYLILLNPWTVWVALIYMSACLFKRSIRKDEVMLVSMIIVGVSLGYFINMYGRSQKYFSLSVFCFFAILAGRYIDTIADTDIVKSVDSRLRVWIFRFFICFLLIGISIHTMKFSKHRNSLRDGIFHLMGRTVFDDGEDRLSNKEYEAYDWIRTNTEDMALLLSDRQLEGDIYTSGVFSERHVYRYQNEEELEQGRKAFLGEEESLRKFIDKGIDYIVQTKSFSPEFRVGGEYCQKVFENADIAVWQIIN